MEYVSSMVGSICVKVAIYCAVSPAYKGGDKNDAGNFCPISVVPKILKKLIASRSSLYHNFLHDHLGAYRHRRSSEH